MRRALIVGINDYKNAELKGCVNDANAIATLLQKHGDGSPNFAIKLLTSPGNNITRSVLRESIDSLFSTECDVALLYFSGHGFINSYGGYIVTKDFKRYDEGISMDDILKMANSSSKAKDKIIILDCCHSGQFGSTSTPSSTPALAELIEGLSILTASRSSESALEINGKGIFTSLVIDALNGGASDLQGYVTPGGIYSYVDKALGAWEQRPIFKTNVSKFISLREVKPPIEISVLRKICEYFVNPEDEFKLDPSFEFMDSRKIDSNVAIFKDLQKFERVGLVVPVGEEHMYFAAMNNKSCKLTAMGFQYWRLAKEGKI